MCSRGGGGRSLRDDCVYLYKKGPLKKWSPQGLPGTARKPLVCSRASDNSVVDKKRAEVNLDSQKISLFYSKYYRHIVYHKKSVYGSQFMITFALTWGSLRLTINCLMMLLP